MTTGSSIQSWGNLEQVSFLSLKPNEEEIAVLLDNPGIVHPRAKAYNAVRLAGVNVACEIRLVLSDAVEQPLDCWLFIKSPVTQAGINPFLFIGKFAEVDEDGDRVAVAVRDCVVRHRVDIHNAIFFE